MAFREMKRSWTVKRNSKKESQINKMFAVMEDWHAPLQEKVCMSLYLDADL
ncbi:hypothetical protein HOLleu_30454 [Holothuria leucospilota]|uniref:Uncharacterized protein n=1 Tax=Holothuria leucospilota TaxID=206669 RepID=A0A9Q1BKP3_HOLLE|nr:hypothetical protein HOLleu_30454 [Holothuria leucospilota]